MLLLFHLFLKNLGPDSHLSDIVSQPTTTKSKKDKKQYVACDYAYTPRKGLEADGEAYLLVYFSL